MIAAGEPKAAVARTLRIGRTTLYRHLAGAENLEQHRARPHAPLLIAQHPRRPHQTREPGVRLGELVLIRDDRRGPARRRNVARG
jgi:hypothetical protein